MDEDHRLTGLAQERPLRADARRNLGELLGAAKAVFAEIGLDAPVRQIAERAGVGVGTLYRHFPRRADLVAAVFRQELDACAASAEVLAAEHPPFAALVLWLREFAALAVTKRGLARALMLDDPAFAGMGVRRVQRIHPAFRRLLQAAVAAGEARADVDPDEFLDAVSSLCLAAHDTRLDYAQRMVALFADGLRPQASKKPANRSRPIEAGR